MDIATHFLIPYATALFLLGLARKNAPLDHSKWALAIVVGAAGFAPDIDGILKWIAYRDDSLYFMQHRGVSHSIVGAPLFGIFMAGALALLARAWPRRASFLRWRPVYIPAAIIGSWTHLVLDAITYAGVPAFWPFSFHRVSLQHFGWLLGEMFVVGMIVLALHLFGKLSVRRVAHAGALAVAYILIIGGIRAYEMPRDLAEGALLFPRDSPSEWVVLEPRENGSWAAYMLRDGERHSPMIFNSTEPSNIVAQEALARVRADDVYRGFLMGSFGPLVANTTAIDGGAAWRITITDVAQRYQALHDPTWTPTEPHDDWGYIEVEVRGDDLRVIHRGW